MGHTAAAGFLAWTFALCVFASPLLFGHVNASAAERGQDSSATDVGRCLKTANNARADEPGVVFLAACHVRGDKFALVAKGFPAGVSVHLAFEDAPHRYIAIIENVARVPASGKVKLHVEAPPKAKYVSLHVDHGDVGWSPLSGRGSP